jgi:hypothetical protein
VARRRPAVRRCRLQRELASNHALRREADAWRASLGQPRPLDEAELTIIIGSIAHLAYHLGAIRQIDRSIRGPQASD